MRSSCTMRIETRIEMNAPFQSKRSLIRRTVVVLVAGAVFGMMGLFFLSWRPTIAAIERPSPASFSAELVSKGESLAAAWHCMSCHIRPAGQPYAGGYGVNTPFGVIYGSNIPPDPETGIGRWSLDAF